MAVKSIIDIEVNDGAFKSFKSIWDKYEAALKKSPEAWDKIAKGAATSKKSFDALVSGMVAANVQAKMYAEAQRKADIITEGSADRWKGIATHTKNVAHNINTATLSLMKWGTISTAVTGLLGIGSLFGLDRLAGSAMSWRQNATGTGTTIGGYQAFTNAFRGVLSDPASFLHTVAAGQINPAKEGVALRFAGVSERDIHSDSTTTAIATMDALFRFAKSHPKESLGLLAERTPIGQLASGEELRRLQGLDPKEYAEQRREALDQAHVADADASKWAQFNRTLGAAGNKIEDVFINRLAPLTEPLSRLSAATVKVVEAFLSPPGFGKLIEEISKGLGDFADYIGKDQFKEDVKNFASGLSDMVTGLGKVVKWIADKIDSKDEDKGSLEATAKAAAAGFMVAGPIGAVIAGGVAHEKGGAIGNWLSKPFDPFGLSTSLGTVNSKSGWWTPARIKQGVDFLKSPEGGGLPDVSARAMIARFAGVESTNGGPNAVNGIGASGIAQWLRGRQGGSFKLGDYEAQLKHVAEELKSTEGSAYSKLLGAKIEQDAAIGAAIFERAEGYDPSHPERGDNWVGKTMKTMKSGPSIWDQPAGRYKADTPNKTNIQILGSVGYDPINITQTASHA